MIRPTVRPRQRWIWPIHSASGARQVVVDRDDVHAAAGDAVEVGGQGRHERLAFAGLHLGDPAEVQRGAAHELHVEVALADRALGRLAGDGERLDQEVVEVLAVVETLTELGGLRLRARRRTAAPVSGSSALMSGTRPASARTFLPSPDRRTRSKTPMGHPDATGPGSPRAPPDRPSSSGCRGASRGRRRRRPPSGSAGGASRGCCARGS